MTRLLTKEQLAEMRERFIRRILAEYEDVQDVFERLEEADLATAKLATAKVCEKCGGKFKDAYHQPGMIHYITDSDDERCPPYHWRDCPHCTNGIVIDDERARELLQKAKERDAAYDYGSRLLKCIWPEETHPDFEVLPDMLGLMTQLDHALATRRIENEKLLERLKRAEEDSRLLEKIRKLEPVIIESAIRAARAKEGAAE